MGALNHFMLPHADASRRHDAREVGGAFLMERLTEALVARGAILSRLQARIFGGGNLIGTDIGRQNIEFAINFLRNRQSLCCRPTSAAATGAGCASGPRKDMSRFARSNRRRRNLWRLEPTPRHSL